VEALKIVLLCVGAAVLYGIGHDLITAHLCVEYFTLAHPTVVRSTDPVLLGLVWGVLGTWYVGAVLAIPLACGARLGAAPPWAWRRLVRPLALLLGVMATGAAIAAIAGGLASRRSGWCPIEPPDLLAADRIPRFAAAWCAHATSYGFGFLGGLALPVVVWIRRGPPASASVVGR
jgi:hypothetical protein